MPVPMIMPFVNDSLLIMGRGMTGVTGNFYTGLDAQADMAFRLHFRRHEDLFCDVDANIGSFLILASAAVGAYTYSFEPISNAFHKLRRNIEVDRIGRLVTLQQVGTGPRN